MDGWVGGREGGEGRKKGKGGDELEVWGWLFFWNRRDGLEAGEGGKVD